MTPASGFLSTKSSRTPISEGTWDQQKKFWKKLRNKPPSPFPRGPHGTVSVRRWTAQVSFLPKPAQVTVPCVHLEHATALPCLEIKTRG